MALLFRFSSILPPPNSAASKRRRTSTSFKFPLRFTSLPLELKKFITSQFANGSTQRFGTCKSLQHIQSKSLQVTDSIAYEVNELGKSPLMVLIITNVLLLSIPFDALALETCEADKSVFSMPILLLVALIGATVGGLVARQRKGEMEGLNEQLRQINTALRRQAKIESYAPRLSYTPVGSTSSRSITNSEVIVDPRKEELICHLKTGKNFLRNQDPEKAFTEFKTGLQLAQDLKKPTEEKKAARGLGASLQRQGKYREAIKYHKMVLSISKRVGEKSGNIEAYGAIADCYTEVGELEQAAKFYDKYIAHMEFD
ncbi:protein FLUORESCENT IN BLUE LIGHT, chloroplastic-like [Impatiens glandulifera]|uniref:protein FLUORESCENT IN BLUE LIGHT, chloroplastic-like n=1 Tax=Impatiens glandulifera TaxID=253017 RepID=UPI001FB1652D|nr:protein FLUORESCENT IN BLUE LIGHT, chloroplastic-like [Impatiens glandulifera]